MIKLMISDFDGTLVNTFEANFLAYDRAMKEVGILFHREDYERCFGYRFDRFMQEMGIEDNNLRNRIKELKQQYYPLFFNHIKVNQALVELLATFRNSGGRVAIASTARRPNLLNVLNHFNLTNNFDLIKSGEDVSQGKPSPEIYLQVMEEMKIPPYETLIFEDSEVGIEAAQLSKAQWIKITM